MAIRVHIILADSRDEMDVQAIKPAGDRNARGAMEVMDLDRFRQLGRAGVRDLLTDLGRQIGHHQLLEEAPR